MSELYAAMIYATLAGAAIPLGAFVARVEYIRPNWLEEEFRHLVIAFGGGALFSAVALVLVPKGIEHLSVVPAVAAFGAGGLAFFLVDRLIERSGGTGAQVMAMLLDFVPESMALGALLAADRAAGILLALIIALQNLPEGFNAWREIVNAGHRGGARLFAIFCALVILGPLGALFGFIVLQDFKQALGAIMLFAAGGIVYLTFGDIAPQARLERHWAPPLGAVAGFMLGLAGHMVVG